MEDFVKNFLAEEYKLDKNIFKQIGGLNQEKTFKIEYDGKIELEFKKINKISDNDFEIYLSNNFDDNSCITIQINKKNKVASIHNISKEKLSCFNHADFLLKKPSSFYVEMSIKLLKKYKEKFNIDKITLIDNAVINCEMRDSNNFNIGKFNLSQYLLFTKGHTWYEEFGFKITDEIKNKVVQNSKIVIKTLKIKDIDFDPLFKDASESKNYKYINDTVIKQVKKILKDNKNQKFMTIMKHIFYDNRTDETCLLYNLINSKLVRQLEKKFDKFTRLEQLEYHFTI
jgi:hypothetical protein